MHSSDFDREQALLLPLKESSPELFIVPQEEFSHLHRKLGIIKKLEELPRGIIKHVPYDFIVEEITPQGDVIPVDRQDAAQSLPAEKQGEGALYIEATKHGISTLDLVNQLRESFSLQENQIGYAGIKDAGALTAQRISIRGISEEVVANANISHVKMNHIIPGKGAMSIGELTGNRFTLLIRMPAEEQNKFDSEVISKISQDGIYNYYGTQRFGSPRFIAHILGKYLCRGEWKKVVDTYLLFESVYEWPYVKNIRKQARDHYGDWEKMLSIYEQLPYSLRWEQEIVTFLIQQKNNQGREDWLGVLKHINQQVKMWVMAYASYCSNLLLSALEREGSAPETIPLLLSRNVEFQQVYRPLLERDGTTDFYKHLRNLDCISFADAPMIPTKIFPKMHAHAMIDEGLIISFDLPKGAYATIVLMNLFQDIPETTKQDFPDIPINTKKILGTGDIQELIDIFGIK